MGLPSRPLFRAFVIGALGTFILIAVYEFHLGAVEARLEAQLKIRQAALAGSEETVERIKAFKSDQSRLQHLITTVNQLSGNDFNALGFSSAVRLPLQGTLEIDAIRIRRGRFHISVVSDDTAAVSRYAERLLQQSGFSRVDVKRGKNAKTPSEFLIRGNWDGAESCCGAL